MNEQKLDVLLFPDRHAPSLLSLLQAPAVLPRCRAA
jgi:hypothetical protein